MKEVLKFASPYVFQDEEQSASSSEPKKREQQADVNIITLQLGHLTQNASHPLTGDPLCCSKCKAIFNSLSKLKTAGNEQLWECEFCGSEKVVNLDQEEIPQSPDLDYIVEPVNVRTTEDDSLIIFCIDTSGSMCVTSEVPVQSTSKADEKKSALKKFIDKGADQRLPNEKKNVSYVSRLQSVQAAVSTQIQTLHKATPKKKLGIITFNDEVTVIGDGTIDPVTVAGDRLHEYDALLQIGKKVQMGNGLEKTKDSLLKQISSLEEQGGTALGPALAIACSMAANHSGSRVIICTDGFANTGVGSVDAEREEDKDKHFYDKIAGFAKLAGISVSVITIAGTECSMENLGKVADATGGEVEIVDPIKIEDNFKNIIEKPVIATNVRVTLVAHPAIIFNESDKPMLTRDIGNVTMDTNTTIEFSVVPTKLISVPFQCQVTYRRPGGPQCVRVITTNRPITKNREEAERNVDVLVIGVHVSKKSANLVQDGKYKAARENAIAHRQLLERAVHTEEQRNLLVQYDAQLDIAEEELGHATKQEEVMGLSLDMEESIDGISDVRSAARTDRTAAHMYHLKGSKAAACVVM